MFDILLGYTTIDGQLYYDAYSGISFPLHSSHMISFKCHHRHHDICDMGECISIKLKHSINVRWVYYAHLRMNQAILNMKAITRVIYPIDQSNLFVPFPFLLLCTP